MDGPPSRRPGRSPRRRAGPGREASDPGTPGPPIRRRCGAKKSAGPLPTPRDSTRLPPEGHAIRLLSIADRNYLDDAEPGATAHRAFVAGLVRAGFAVEVLAGSTLSDGPEVDPAAWLTSRGLAFESSAIEPPPGTPLPGWPHPASHLRLEVEGVPVHLLGGPSALPHDVDEPEAVAFLSILEHLFFRGRPDVLLAHGADRLAAEALRRARSRGIATALRLRDRGPHHPLALDAADVVLAPSTALADELREATGRPCVPLPDFLDPATVRAEGGDRKYLAFFDPTPAGGLAAFARIADELGRLRPDIPLLVVAGPEGRERLDLCGLDLKRHGNIALMKPPADPRLAWARVRVALAPALDGSCPPRSAIEAVVNGLPVVASDRGGLPEVLGDCGFALPLPDRITPATRLLPSEAEVRPWVEAIVRLWDDGDLDADHRQRAAIEARRWDPRALALRYAEAFRGLRPGAVAIGPPPGRSRAIALVPHLNGIEPECEAALQGLERLGVRVLRRRGCSAIDVARSEMASNAVHDGLESILFIDADIAFDPFDALRLLARPEPVVSGLYAKKGTRETASSFAEGVEAVHFGPDSPGLYPQKYAAAGFLRIRTAALRRLIAELDLPLCNLDWGRGCWPFFLSLIVEGPSGRPHYLGEDWAFCHRLRQVGITPLADASIRLWHHGSFAYGWEDAGEDRPRYRSYHLSL